MDKEYEVVIDGNTVNFEFKDSLIHAEGEHAGNIDAIITTKPPLPQNLLLDELHIKLPDSDEYLYIYGYGAVENSLKATFNSSVHVNVDNLPEIVEVYWGENGDQYIGEMCCRRFTEEIEHDLADEISETIEEEIDKQEEAPVSKEESNQSVQEKPENKKINKETEESNSTPEKNKLYLIAGSIIFLLIMLFIIFQ